MTEPRQQQAQTLHNEGAALADAGDREGALAKYMAALADAEALKAIIRAGDGDAEDWTGNVRSICKACSEGRPHESHDHDGGPAPWRTERRIGVAARSEEQVQQWLEAWEADGRAVTEWGPALER